jgi:serine protease Do
MFESSAPHSIQAGIGGGLTAVTERLRRITVQVHGARAGMGSGVIWASDGLIVTNAHVAQGRRVGVVLPDGGSLEARLLAWDPERDLAALAIDAHGLSAADLGDSTSLRVGELVIAVGNPLGLAGAVTAGVIHAIGPRHSAGPSFIQADLRLAPGNSGGPLANAYGRVIGINAMVAGGLALAVPSSLAARFLAPLQRRAAAVP